MLAVAAAPLGAASSRKSSLLFWVSICLCCPGSQPSVLPGSAHSLRAGIGVPSEVSCLVRHRCRVSLVTDHLEEGSHSRREGTRTQALDAKPWQAGGSQWLTGHPGRWGTPAALRLWAAGPPLFLTLLLGASLMGLRLVVSLRRGESGMEGSSQLEAAVQASGAGRHLALVRV